MQELTRIRNVAILGHLGSGKTSLTEGLYSIATGKEKGSIEKKNTISDYSLEEQNKGSSIRGSIVPITYKDHKINLIDLPGSDDFIGEVIATLDVVKGAVLVINATSGVEVQTIRHWNMLRKKNIPTIIYVNKMDKENVKFENLLEEIRTKLGKNAIPFCYPMGHEEEFDGFVNCVTLKARKFDGKVCVDAEIYPEKKAKTLELHNTMVEAVAQTKEELMDKFFNGEILTNDEIKEGLRTGVLNGELIPVLVGSAIKNIGLHTMLDMFIDYLPNPSDLKPISAYDEELNEIKLKTTEEELFAGLVFKTIVDPYAGVSSIFKVFSGTIKLGDEIYISKLNQVVKVSSLAQICGSKITPVTVIHAGDIGVINKIEGIETGCSISSSKKKVHFDEIEFPTAVYFKAIKTKSKNDDDKLSTVLNKLMLEDKCIEIRRNNETKQLLIGSLGLNHLNYILEKIKNTYKIELEVEDVKIVYRETITKEASANGRYVKQSGGSGFYGVVDMKFKPAKENIFKEEIFGGSVPKNYFPAVEKGFYEACEKGLLGGFSVIGVEAILFDGKYHPVDSNELAFKMASILAFKEAYMNCSPIVLEPIIKVVVTCNNDIVGDVLSDLNQRRGKVTSMDINSLGLQKVTALVPEAEILEYVNDLKSLSQGSAYFNREFASYEPVPQYLQAKVLENNKMN